MASQMTPEQLAQRPRCFITPDRACGPDCMAFLTAPPNQGDYLHQKWANCHLLVNIHRGGKHLVIVAESLSKLLKPDTLRQQSNIPPPEVR